MNTIAIDCGASFVKCALFEDDIPIRTEQIAAPSNRDGIDIFNTEKIEKLISIVQHSLDTFLTEAEGGAICIDNEMHGFILAYADGTPYTDYISWQMELMAAQETDKFLKELVGEDRAVEMISRTGMPLRSGLPSSTLLWMSRNQYLTGKGELYFYTLGDYIIRRIFGKEPVCHQTNAAATGLFDLETGTWNEEYISLLTGKEKIIFPLIGKESIEYARDARKFHILPAIGDQQAALLGSGLKGENELSFNMGTGAQVSRLLKKEKLRYGDYQVRPYFYRTFLKTIPHVPAGRTLNVFFRFLKDILSRIDSEIEDKTVWRIMQDAISPEAMNADNLRCDLSFFENAITDHREGSITKITEYGLTLESLLSSIFRQMVDNFVMVANRVNEGLLDYDTIIFSGGIAKRWSVMRNGIVEKLLPDAKVIVSEYDTLFGCMRYAVMDAEDR